MAPARPTDRDVVIIGAGLAGLTAAGLLSGAGLGVTVVEAQPRPGGYLQGFSRAGFTFDTAVQWLNGLRPDGLVHRVLSFLGEDYPRCRPLTRIWRFRSPSYDYLLDDEPDRLRDRLVLDFPAQAEGLRRLFADGRRLGDRWAVLYRRMRALETMGPWTKISVGLKMLGWYLPVRRLLRSGMEPGLARYVDEPHIRQIFCADEQLANLLVPIGWSYARDFFAPPTGGCQAWVRWLVERLQARGSDIRLSTPVERVQLEGGRAVGVVTTGGEVLRARWVLAACDLQALYERMLPAEVVPASLKQRLDEADLYYSHFSLFVGLDCPAEELGLGEEMVRLCRDDLTCQQHSSGDPEQSALNVLAPSVRDPSLAPAGKGTLTIHCPAWLEHFERWQTGPALARGPAYLELKQRLAAGLLARVERELVPGLTGHVESLEIATPVTYWRYTGNRLGSIMGSRPTDRNIRNRLAHYRTPVPGLLLGGHWSEYGGGVPMAVKSAANTSLLILQRTDRRAFERLRDLVDGRGLAGI